MPRWTTDARAALALVALLAAPLAAQEPPGLGDLRPGPQYCANCHFHVPGNTIMADDGLPKYWVGEHWSGWQADPHRRANEVLDQPLGRQMAKLLAEHSSDPASWKGGVRSDARCTSCHGGAPKGDLPPTAGLNCFDCHQQPGGNDKWMTLHAFMAPSKDPRISQWRALGDLKKREYGFRPLHDAAERAKACLSCHVGNAKEGKFVTHEMYAAGHPPLGSVELAKFSEDAYAERHWLPPDHDSKTKRGFENDVAKLRAYLAVHGALAGLSAQAELAVEAVKPDPAFKHVAWGDYAFHDCAACHHDLTKESWRRKRAEAGPAATGSKVYGRPPLLEWPSVAALAMHGDALRRPLDEFRFAATETPFGNPAKVAATGHALKAALEKAVPKADALDDWRALLRQSLELGAHGDLDFDSARQLAWLAESLAHSLSDDPFAKAVRGSLPKLGFPTEPRYLPKWTKADGKIPDLADAHRLQGMAAMLTAKRAYDPAAFRQWCRETLAASTPASQ
jgi:3',5'-cyclic AMP phosphodiesterase CpdA